MWGEAYFIFVSHVRRKRVSFLESAEFPLQRSTNGFHNIQYFKEIIEFAIFTRKKDQNSKY